MKHLVKLLSLLLLLGAGLFFGHCSSGDGNEKSAEEIEFNKLKFAWTLKNETATFNNGGSSEVRNFPGMTLLITGSFATGANYHYSVDVTDNVDASPWPAAGDWKFSSATNPTSGFTRLDSKIDATYDDIPMTYTLSNNDKTLTIEFEFNGGGFALNGRAESVTGNWEFIFTRP